MCDHLHYKELEERVDAIEKQQTEADKTAAVLNEQIKNLVKSTDNLKHVVYAFTFLLLLAVIWGAIGPDGFNAVTHAAPTTAAQAAAK